MSNYLDRSGLNILIENIAHNTRSVAPIASILIVTYKTKKETVISVINKLKKSSSHSFEILLIDNNEKSDLAKIADEEELTYIKLRKNYGLTTGRNVGIMNARGDILIFLDDDAIPAEGFIDEHIRAHQDYQICALRGKCVPLTNSTFNYLAPHYDLGNEVVTSAINLEGNSSFSREILISIGGFNPFLKGSGGHEGLEISNRIFEKTKNRNSIIYYPRAVIHHDYSKSLVHFLNKQIRHQNHLRFIAQNDPAFIDFFTSYESKAKIETRNLGLVARIKLLFIRNISRSVLKLNFIINGMIETLNHKAKD